MHPSTHRAPLRLPRCFKPRASPGASPTGEGRVRITCMWRTFDFRNTTSQACECTDLPALYWLSNNQPRSRENNGKKRRVNCRPVRIYLNKGSSGELEETPRRREREKVAAEAQSSCCSSLFTLLVEKHERVPFHPSETGFRSQSAIEYRLLKHLCFLFRIREHV